MEILFHDIDGCLNTPDGSEIPIGGQSYSTRQKEFLKVLGQALDESRIDLMAINTGRSLPDSQTLAAAIGSKKLRYMLLEHGAILFDVEKHSQIDWVSSVTNNDKNESPLYLIQAFIQWYKTIGHKLLIDRLGTEMHIVDKVANLTLEIPADIDSAYMYELVRGLIQGESPFDCEEFIFHCNTADGFIDVMSSIDKGDGIDTLCKHIKESSAKTIAVGNGLNDLPMLERADFCLCPENSEREVKEYCRNASGVVSQHRFIEATIRWLEDYR